MIAQLACKFIIYQEESECIGENNQIKKKKEKKKNKEEKPQKEAVEAWKAERPISRVSSCLFTQLSRAHYKNPLQCQINLQQKSLLLLRRIYKKTKEMSTGRLKT